MTTALRIEPQVESVETRLFGTLTVTPNDKLLFDGGIPGFPDAQTFVLLTTQAPALRWLQSVEDPGLAFLLVEYDRVVEETAPWTPSAHAIVTLPGHDRLATVNLRAPVLIDQLAGTGAQMILTDSTRGTAEAIDLDTLMQERPARS